MMTYLICAKNAFRSNATYRFNTFFSTVSILVSVYVQIAIWKALYTNTSNMATSYGNIELRDMITYVIVSAFLDIVMQNHVIQLIDRKIKTGEIVFDINRPYNFFGYLLSITVGENIYRFLFQFTVIAVLMIPIFSIKLPGFLSLVLFVISVFGGLLIQFILSFTLGLLGFWYLRIWHMERVIGIAIQFFSGAFVPIWFFPPQVDMVGSFLPFKYIFFVPISIFLEKVSVSNACTLIVLQVVWILALSLIATFVWRKGITKLVVQGG